MDTLFVLASSAASACSLAKARVSLPQRNGAYFCRSAPYPGRYGDIWPTPARRGPATLARSPFDRRRTPRPGLWNAGDCIAPRVPEVIEHGVTGFVVDNESEAIDAINRVGEFDRYRTRQEFEHRFTVRRMAEQHVELYRDLSLSKTHVAAA